MSNLPKRKNSIHPHEKFITTTKICNKNGCVLWCGKMNRAGYGLVYGFKKNGRTPSLGAHRVALQTVGVDVPKDSVVLHTCDTPACVNPSHLVVGTTQDNLADMRAKGRQCNGERMGNAKFTDSQIQEMRHYWAREKCSKAEACRKFGVSRSYGRVVLLGLTRKEMTRSV